MSHWPWQSPQRAVGLFPRTGTEEPELGIFCKFPRGGGGELQQDILPTTSKATSAFI